jgi:hypothetical protein
MRTLSLALAFVLANAPALLAHAATPRQDAPQQPAQQPDAPAQQAAADGGGLSNKDVLDLHKAGLSAEVLIAKIKSSRAAFDTQPAALQELKAAGVPDAVILAVVQAASDAATAVAPAQPAAATVETKVADGTAIEIELKNNVSGQEAKIGDVVDFTVLHPVVVGGVTVFEKGASARARITTAKKAGRWGKAGKLEWAMQDVQAADGNRVPARFTQRALGDSKGGTVAVAAVATTVLLGPVGLLWGLKKGKPAVIAAGNRYSVFVHGDTVVKGHAPATAAVPAQ